MKKLWQKYQIRDFSPFLTVPFLQASTGRAYSVDRSTVVSQSTTGRGNSVDRSRSPEVANFGLFSSLNEGYKCLFTQSRVLGYLSSFLILFISA